ncbi:MAG: PTS sugar transporter subunit IIC [Negativicutes bacterium]|nr:PTS sugar transporter subunit IIC [Negativicutes bacterium]
MGEALLVAAWAGLCGVDMFNGIFHIHRPLVVGTVVGLIMGNLEVGLLTGAAIELVFLGMAPLAGAQPPNPIIAGIVGTAFAIKSGLAPEAAVGIAVPFAIAMQAMITLLFTAFSPVMHKADQYAAAGDTAGIERINYLGMTVLFILYAVISFLPVYFGQEVANAIISTIPEKVITGLKIAGGMMPAIGFGILLKIMFKKSYAWCFIIGFVLAAYLKMNVLSIALVALSVAMYDYYLRKDVGTPQGPRGGGRTDGI